MKRHPSLIPLSHDHHAGLVLAHRLIRGQAKSPRSDWPKEPAAQRQRVLEIFRKELASHFEAEEKFLFPLAEAFLGEDESSVSRLIRDHREIRRTVDGLAGLEGEDLRTSLESLGRLLEDHIRTEEGTLFQAMQRKVPEEKLVECGRRIESFYRELERPAPGTCLT